jgi:hypothetical protein
MTRLSFSLKASVRGCPDLKFRFNTMGARRPARKLACKREHWKNGTVSGRRISKCAHHPHNTMELMIPDSKRTIFTRAYRDQLSRLCTINLIRILDNSLLRHSRPGLITREHMVGRGGDECAARTQWILNHRGGPEKFVQKTKRRPGLS